MSNKNDYILGEEDKDYIATYDDLVVFEAIDRIRAQLPPPTPPHGEQKKKASAPPKKNKLKQMPIKKAIKNMKEKNFQGYDIALCTPADDGSGKMVYYPKRYGGKSRKKFRNRATPLSHKVCCSHCHLRPCSMIEFLDDLEAVVDSADTINMEESTLLEKVRNQYRIQINKNIGKKYLLKFMPNTNQIPPCALSGTKVLAKREYGGYDSLLDSM